MPTADPIAGARAGDPAAWSALLAAHGPAIYGLCRRFSPDPDDAYQEVWEKVHRRIDRFDPDRTGSFRGWLLTVAHHHLIDRHRRSPGPPPEPDPIGAPTPDLEIDRRRRLARVEAALAHLPIADRRALVLHHLEDRDLDEIAHLEGVPRGTVKSRLHRARCRLIALLGGSGE